MPKMKFYDDATSQWIELDAKDADTVGGKSFANIQSEITTRIANKVDKVSGKGLSTNDYTTAEKNKLSGLHTVATSGSYNDLSNKPTAANIDVVNLDSTVEDLIEFHDEQIKKKVDKTGDTMTGILTAQSNTSYTTRQVRNMILSTSDAVNSQMQNGDIWIKYK